MLHPLFWGTQPGEITLNTIEESKFKKAQNDAQVQRRQIGPVAHLPCGLQFKPLAACLMIVEIFEGSDRVNVKTAPLDPLPDGRLAQFENAWAKTSNGRTIPVGVILVGNSDETNRCVDELRFVPATVHLLPEFYDSTIKEMTDALDDFGVERASMIIRYLRAVADEVDSIHPTRAKPDLN